MAQGKNWDLGVGRGEKEGRGVVPMPWGHFPAYQSRHQLREVAASFFPSLAVQLAIKWGFANQ